MVSLVMTRMSTYWVVLPFKGKPVRKAIEIRNKVNAVVPLDLIVRTPEQVAERLAQNDWFMREIVERGRTLYEANQVGEKLH